MKINIMNFKTLILLFLLVISFSAQLLLPTDYLDGSCELVAKDFQEQFGGYLVLTMAYLDNTNIPDKSGHWINKIYMKGNNQYYYIDYTNQKIFSTKEEANSFYSNSFKNKFDNGNVESRLFVYGVDTIPFPLIHYY